MKIADERETQKATKNPPKTNQTSKDRKEKRGTNAIVKRSELNYFVVHLN